MKTTVFSLLICIMLFACKKSDNSNNNSNFAGTWKGSYSGSEKGTWIMIIDNGGKVTGYITREYGGAAAEATGFVTQNGDISMAVGASDIGATFKGKLVNGSGSGTWENPSYRSDWNGTWTGIKQ